MKCIKSEKSLIRGAVGLSLGTFPDVNTSAICKEIELLAWGSIKSLKKRLSSPSVLLAFAHRFLFDEVRFSGNCIAVGPTYFFLPTVLESKRGASCILCLIYKAVLEELGFKVSGLVTPGRMIVSVENDDDDKVILIDPFDMGREVTVKDIEQRVSMELRRDFELSKDVLNVNNAEWLFLIAQHLIMTYSLSHDWDNMCVMMELQMLLMPNEPQLARNLSNILLQSGREEAGRAWRQAYISMNPNGVVLSPQLLKIMYGVIV